MFFARKRSANATAAHVFVCAKAKRQQQHDIGHSVVATGRGVLRLSSSISADVWTR
ncbi:hypothetical protein FJQ98_17955 [Lysinibacillus agricola]|uniref:Uncharacterized protein n=1 Tax=Lysinibacillus agricola TaxID=2590012 RepID=A0ABX7ANK7_9BACI|nr:MULTISPECIES: hypothetical protein [Lysinibacillus]QQP11107.1 hypothetical protein FJQ98_17955 [Lysinibacillus agricola]